MVETTETDGKTGNPEPVRGSALGAIALLCSLIGSGGCAVVGILTAIGTGDALVGVIATACFSILGFALGVIAFFSAKKGTPRGGAIGATFLGAIFGALQGAVVVGALIQFLPLQSQVAPMIEGLVQTASTDDPEAAAKLLGPDATQVVTGDDLVAFVQRVDAAAGGITEVRVELTTLTKASETVQNFAPRPDADPQNIEFPKPIELVTPSGDTVLLGVWLDEEALKDDEVLIRDLIAFLPTGEMLVLRDDGPARTLTEAFAAPVRLP